MEKLLQTFEETIVYIENDIKAIELLELDLEADDTYIRLETIKKSMQNTIRTANEVYDEISRKKI